MVVKLNPWFQCLRRAIGTFIDSACQLQFLAIKLKHNHNHKNFGGNILSSSWSYVCVQARRYIICVVLIYHATQFIYCNRSHTIIQQRHTLIVRNITMSRYIWPHAKAVINWTSVNIINSSFMCDIECEVRLVIIIFIERWWYSRRY